MRAHTVYRHRLRFAELLETFGTALLADQDSEDLYRALVAGSLTRNAFYREVLVVLYRVLFIETAIDQNLLPNSFRPSVWATSWQGLLALFIAVCETLGMSRFSGGLFGRVLTAHVEHCGCDADAVRACVAGLLHLLDDTSVSERLDLAGSLHEWVTCLEPFVESETRPALRLNAGCGRKQYGVYYTPEPLVEHLVDMTLADANSAWLEPGGRRHPTVCDPACGSGRFLVVAARRLARRRMASMCSTTPHQEISYRSAFKEVVLDALHGVDLDPVAVALCQTRLWLEIADPEFPIGALESRVVHGNALLGALRSPEWMSEVGHGGSEAARTALNEWTWRCAGTPSATVRALLAPPMHWWLTFPHIETQGGFDLILCNPPWELVQPEEKSFFQSVGRTDITSLAGARRKQAIQRLTESSPELVDAWERHRGSIAAFVRFASTSNRFPLSPSGKRNTYGLFLETARDLLRPGGRAGCIVPAGFLTDAGTGRLFHGLMESGSIASCRHFFNHLRLFPDIGGNQGFCLVTLRHRNDPARCSRFALRLESFEQAERPERQVTLTLQDLTLMNPNTGTCVLARDENDAALAKRVHRDVPIFLRESPVQESPWQVAMRQGLFNMTSDSHLFCSSPALEASLQSQNIREDRTGSFVPLLEAKMFHQFDSDWRRKADLPRYWVRQEEVRERLSSWPHAWLVGVRLICRSTDSRTVIASMLPAAACGNSILLLFPQAGSAADHALLVACLNSLALDYLARQKIGGANLNFHILKQLPVLPPERFAATVPWPGGGTVASWLLPRVLELIYTDKELACFARAAGYSGPRFAKDVDRRESIRAEIDAAFFHLYGYNREEVETAISTFAVLCRDESRRLGEFRTKRMVLEAFDNLTH